MIIGLHIFSFISSKEVKKLAVIVSLCFHSEKRTNEEEKPGKDVSSKTKAKKEKASQYLFINSSFLFSKNINKSIQITFLDRT